ncbi:MAG: Hsp20/alpha crystallin family protein [Solobacterium sp.]|nr:Hsp20/alpha crystallin family protein [Solobacterium sp.]
MKYVPEKRNRLFDDMFDDMFRGPSFGLPMTNNLMKTDIRTKDGNYLLDIDLPGYKKEDITISLYNGNLTVSASHNDSQEEKDAKGNIVRQERYSGSCSRTFYVGEGIKETDVKASYENGILTLEVPSEQKKEEAEKKYIDIL